MIDVSPIPARLAPATTEEVATKIGTTPAVVDRAIEAGEEAGLTAEETRGALEDAAAINMDPQAVTAALESQAKKRERKARVTGATQAQAAPPAAPVELKKFSGFITGITPRKREGTGQTYHVIELDNGPTFDCWHRTPMPGLEDAMKRSIQVELSCQSRQVGESTVYSIEEFALVAEKAAAADEPGGMEFGEF